MTTALWTTEPPTDSRVCKEPTMPSDDLAAAEWHANVCDNLSAKLAATDPIGAAGMAGCAACIRAVVARCREQAAEIADQSDFMAFMHTELAKFPCLCEDGKHADTAPMFWPELIRCIVARAVKDAQAEVQHGK